MPLLEILDALRDARKVPDTNTGRVLTALGKRLMDITADKRNDLQLLAVDYYNPGTRAWLGLLRTRSGQKVLQSLKASINPSTSFDSGMDAVDWPEARAWDIR